MDKTVSDLQSKSTFHEIKNQVSVCNLYLEVIKKTLVKENIKNDTINRAINTISNSVKAIENSMQELKAQVVPAKIKSIYLAALINEVFMASVSYADGKDVTFINDVDENFLISADKDKMYSALINLCKNAIEAIENKGFVRVYNDLSSIYVEDNGFPITKKNQKALFDDGFTTKENGSGLGLMLVKKLLDAQKFAIELFASDDEKTTFKISM